MENTFKKLVTRGTFQKETQIADPWETIPIKNRKYARECIEIHLANRSIQQLRDFQNFPNLEVLYLNDNNLEYVEGLDANFRIKNLYLFNNKIKTLEGSLEYLTHLEILSLYNNELRDLDKNIEFLKRFPNLKNLDLFDNPLTEEPNYRFRVIYNLPQIKLFDRHIVTYDERQKAKKLMEQEDFRKKKKDIKKKIAPSQMFSQGEKDLYKNAKTIKYQQQKRIDDEIEFLKTKKELEEKKKAEKDANYVPRSQMAIELEKRRSKFPNSIITEFEKDKIQFIFNKFSNSAKGQEPVVSKENLPKVYEQLVNDEGIIGMIPDCSENEFLKIINPDDLETLDYSTYRYKLNLVYWCKPDKQMTEERIKDYYHKANQKINRGQKSEAFELINLAVRLEKKMAISEDSNKIVQPKKQQVEEHQRFDSFDFGRFTFKKTFTNTVKSIL